jgi:50S ribosomal protein L16 3-hydroxylase
MISFGKLDIEQFIAKHWQKKPLLVRNALNAPESLISVQELLTLSQNGQCEARLISRKKNNAWQLQHGPFSGLVTLPSLTKSGPWTVLVQGVDTVHASINQLMTHFRFAGDALLDDVMISYASDGGGVGPHLDSYDVFLIQLHGQREWRISPPKSTPAIFEEGLPVKILKNFKAADTWLLEAGDMLYLPAGWGHDGVAKGPCMTASVGFRAPHRNEWLNAYLDDLADSLEDALDPNAKRLKLPASLALSRKNGLPKPAQLQAAIQTQFGDWVDELLGKGVAEKPTTKTHIRELSGRFLTDPKPQTRFFSPKHSLSYKGFVSQFKAKGVALSLASRCLYTKTPKIFFLNGESFAVSAQQLNVLASLADTKTLSGSTKVDADILESLHQWYEDGWLVLG